MGLLRASKTLLAPLVLTRLLIYCLGIARLPVNHSDLQSQLRGNHGVMIVRPPNGASPSGLTGRRRPGYPRLPTVCLARSR